jgi:serine/threonine protein kinase
MPTMEVPVAAGLQPRSDGSGEPSPRVSRIISSDSVPAGGFTPGTILVDRYRVIGLLGRGGMGEVYRADDLKLGQPVALKFLPPKLAEDPVRRERFFAEVRITRQLSHPNICRVYDIGDIDGRYFLSMEYIDGEDLASLLKRIGYLSNEKALDIARQLAAGLSAAHERGVLHRDLKPANIMLDCRGRVRITDFGLAIAAEDEIQAAEIAGTPAYMAPEQLAGRGATVRSDIYSLGLILYETYTGKKAFTARTLAELREQKETHTPRAPSEIREGIDPVVERLIRRCMERDPNARPASVAQLAMALPGGDPLAAALAAGETPSPEMVAASGSKEGLRPAVAWGLLAFIVAGTIAIIAMSNRSMLQRLIPFDNSPEILAEHSRQFLRKLGYWDKSANSAYGLAASNELVISILENPAKRANRWKNLDAKSVLFWYRQSPRSLNPIVTVGSTAQNNPPLQYEGEVLVMLDTEGRLISFRLVPPQIDPSAQNAQSPDWTVLFSEAGLDITKWTPVDSQQRPLSYADSRAAWQGSLPSRPGVSTRIEAAALQGKPVSFQIMGPWNQAIQAGSLEISTGNYAVLWVLLLVAISAIVGGIFLARRNVRLGRGDRRNATRLALLVLGLLGINWIIQVPRISFISLLLVPPYVAFLIWIFYMALEPFVRRRWPQVLVSWTRLLSGDWKDPLVARDILIGCAFSVLCTCIDLFFNRVFPSWLGFAELTAPIGIDSISITGTRFLVAGWMRSLVIVIGETLAFLCFLVIMRILLRNQKAAIIVFVLVMAILNGGLQSPWSFAVMLLISALYLFVLMRFGLVANVFLFLWYSLLLVTPISFGSSTWYSGYGYATLAICAAIVLYAFRTSLGDRPLFGTAQLDD